MNASKDDKFASANTTVRNLTDVEIDLRKRWLEFGPGDEAIIEEEIDKLVGGNIDELIESMYTHFL
jgi:hypothetical protein